MIKSIEDIILTQQLYAEAVKNGQAEQMDPTLDAMLAALALVLAKQSFEKMNELSKKSFRALLSDIMNRLRELLLKASNATLSNLYKFMQAEVSLTRQIAGETEKKKTPAPYDSKPKSNAALWAAMLLSIVPATGDTPKGMISTYSGFVLSETRKLLGRAWVEGWSATQILQGFTGANSGRSLTARNKNEVGLIRKFRNAYGAMTDTLMQQIMNSASGGIWSNFFDNYRWVSIMDTRTTDYCRAHNGRVYAYRDGPRPPAHYRCRSRMVPTRQTVRVNAPDTFFEWLSLQPTAVQNFALGEQVARGYRRNGFPITGNNNGPATNRRLTPQEYQNSLNQIVA